MRVPEGVLNFDVNWKKDKKASYNITDIGFCPQIELRAGKQNVVRESEFTEVITQLEAERSLILRFYKSQQINWVSLEEALQMAPAQRKPIHVLVHRWTTCGRVMLREWQIIEGRCPLK